MAEFDNTSGFDLDKLDFNDDTSWVSDLETALVEDCDFESISNICKGRPVPEHLRCEVWQICLGIVGKDALSAFDGLYDLENQSEMRSDCILLVDQLANEVEDKVSIISDLESILTYFCKSQGLQYVQGNGWLKILQVLLAVKMERAEIYNCFYTISNKFIPFNCQTNGRPFNLFRLILQYHDPELCSYLDTRRVTPDLYIQTWLNSLFGGVCDLNVCLSMWDIILQHADPFLPMFMSLVILVNGRDTILDTKDNSKGEIIDLIKSFPQALEAEDVEDFCSLAQYYASKSSQSFRRDYQLSMFGGSMMVHKDIEPSDLCDSLCLMVSGEELLQANQGPVQEDAVRYFVVDCRPAKQYNSEHLTTAFHLDANLMLRNPEEFSAAVQALFAAQAQALTAGSTASGEHLCFLGSGCEDEDQYVTMVVANILQRGKQYVSIAKGGFTAINNILKAASENGLADNSLLVINNSNGSHDNKDFKVTDSVDDRKPNQFFSKVLFGKVSGMVKAKSAEIKEKLTNYIKDEQLEERHVSTTQNGARRYRNMTNVFTIGDDDDGEDNSGIGSDDEGGQKEEVSLDTWRQKADVVYSCRCEDICSGGNSFSSYLLVTSTHLYVLREILSEKGLAQIQARRALGSIIKITSKKKQPELITFQYGTQEVDGFHVTDRHRFFIPMASDIKNILTPILMKNHGKS